MINTLYAPTRKNGVPVLLGGLALYRTSEGSSIVELSLHDTGMGKRTYLVCPICKKRRVKLYISNGIVGCRLHVSGNAIYAGVQHKTKGGADRIGYTMQKIAEKNGVPFKLGRNPIEYILNDERPQGMHKRIFADIMARLYALEWLRIEAIFFHRQNKRPERPLLENVKDIKAIERGTEEERRQNIIYCNAMSIAQEVYKKDWGFTFHSVSI